MVEKIDYNKVIGVDYWNVVNDEEVEQAIQEKSEITTKEQREYSLKEVMDLMKKLAEVQSNKAIVTVALKGKQIKRTFNESVDSAKSWIDMEEGRYGVKGKSKEILKLYNQEIKEIEDTIREERNGCIKRMSEYEYVEHSEAFNIKDFQNKKDTLIENKSKLAKEIKETRKSSEYVQLKEVIQKTKKELQHAIKQGDTNKIEQLNFNLRNIQNKQEEIMGGKEKQFVNITKEIKQLKNQVKWSKENLIYARENIKREIGNLKECNSNFKNAVNFATKSKNQQIAEVQKPNRFTKLIKSIMDKVGGSKKFANNVIAPFKNQIEEIKQEKIPKIKEEVAYRIAEQEIKCNQFKEKVKNKGQGIKEKAFLVKEEVKEKSQSIKEGIEEKAYYTKEGFKEKVWITGNTIEAAKDVVLVRLSNTANKGRETVREIIQKGKYKKDNIILKAAGSLQNKIDKVVEETRIKQENIRTIEK